MLIKYVFQIHSLFHVVYAHHADLLSYRPRRHICAYEAFKFSTSSMILKCIWKILWRVFHCNCDYLVFLILSLCIHSWSELYFRIDWSNILFQIELGIEFFKTFLITLTITSKEVIFNQEKFQDQAFIFCQADFSHDILISRMTTFNCFWSYFSLLSELFSHNAKCAIGL